MLSACHPTCIDYSQCSSWCRCGLFHAAEPREPQKKRRPRNLSLVLSATCLFESNLHQLLYGNSLWSLLVFPTPEMYPLLLFIQGVQGIPLLQNITIPLPNGTSNHGTPGILCTPTRWTDILIFYLANYAAHAATTRSLPGEDASSFAIIVMAALLFPAAGAFRGILGIRSLSMFGKTDLEKAARAGALCMVVRTHKWRPNASDSLHNTIICLPSGVTKGENENSEEGLPTATQENRTQSNNMAPNRLGNDPGIPVLIQD
jgi:hypothetical protein